MVTNRYYYCPHICLRAYLLYYNTSFDEFLNSEEVIIIEKRLNSSWGSYTTEHIVFVCVCGVMCVREET